MKLEPRVINVPAVSQYTVPTKVGSPSGAEEFTFVDPSYPALLEYIDTDSSAGRQSKYVNHYKRKTKLGSASYSFALSENGTDQANYYVWSTTSKSYRFPGSVLGDVLYPVGPLDSSSSSYPRLKGIVTVDTTGRYIVNSPDNVNGLVDRSLMAMLPGIRPSLSLVNSLIELKDLSSAPKLMRQMLELQRTFKVAPAKKTLRRILRASLGSGFLNAQFNANPMFDDVLGLVKALRQVSDQLRQLIDNEKKVLRRHFALHLPEYIDATYGIDTTHSVLSGVIRHVRSCRYSHRLFVATIDYSYRIVDMPSWLASVNAHLDAFGVNLNPAILWNAIPWSFVLDWVIGVSRWLDQFKVRAIQPQTVIHDYCYSLHVARTIDVSRTHGHGGWWQGYSTVTDVSVEEDAFIRVPHRPDFFRSIQTSGLNLKEFSLAAALALSR